ncbi:EAL domain-containing protein [Pseudomonadota bacterium]
MALDAVDFGLLVVGQGGVILFLNDWLVTALDINEETALGSSFNQLFPELAETQLVASVDACLSDAHAVPSVFSGRFLPVVGQDLPLGESKPASQKLLVKPLEITGQQHCCLIQVFDSSYQRSDIALLREKERLEVTLSSISDGVIITDINGRIEYLNSVAEKHTGRKSQDTLGQSLHDVLILVAGVTDSDATVSDGDDGFGYLDPGLVLVGADGQELPVELSVAAIDDGMGGQSGSVVVFRDITHSREMAAQLFWQSSHDALTGLANRQLFERRLKKLLDDNEGGDKEHAVLYLDVDQFKIINDTCGHTAGDDLLLQLTGLLKTEVRRSDTLARLGGDEFGVLLEDCPLDIALRITNELRQLINDFTFAWEGKVFPVAISIGLVPVNGASTDVTEILSAADTACFTAKDSGRNRVHVFKHGNSEASKRHGEMQWVTHIHSALDNDRLTLFSQLIVPVSNTRDLIPHREVLLRMFDEEGNIIPPGAFIPAAERYNLMPALDRWVVSTALEYFAELRAEGKTEPFMMNINLSGASLVQEGFLDFVLEQLNSREIPHWLVCFEVTETAAIANLEEARKFIDALRDMGCKFALDDFGSGLSSFGYLKQLPVDYLKIDGAFIRDIMADPIHGAMVEAINRVGHIMGIQTVAEFVEDGEALACLKEIGVDYAQGYYIEKPGPLNGKG